MTNACAFHQASKTENLQSFMYYVFFDESKYPQKNFIIGSFVFCEELPTSFISETLSQNGFDPFLNEYKSSVHFGRNPNMKNVRDSLKQYLHEHCLFGVVVMHHSQIKELGLIALQALKQFIQANNFCEGNFIYFDEGIFKNTTVATKTVESLGLSGNTFYFEQDSKAVKGIQLADLCAHSLTTILREALGDLSKNVKAGENSGYDPEEELEIGFDIWSTIRYSFLREVSKEYIPDTDQEVNLTYEVEPYGLFIAPNCDESFTKIAKETFGTVFLGCIH